MKSYIQGLITGAVFVFAIMVLMGANDGKGEVGRYQIIDVDWEVLSGRVVIPINSVFKIDTKMGETWRFVEIEDQPSNWIKHNR